MNTLLFHKTTDADLSKGLLVAYNDLNGQPTLIGTIDKIQYDSIGSALYIVEGLAYTANELTLIQPEPANNWDELKVNVLQHKNFVPVTEELYFEALGVLPPIYLKNGCFMVNEPITGNIYYVFGKKNGLYYGCLCNKNFALNNF